MAKSDNNFNELTPRARQVILFAKAEAEHFNHDCIGPELFVLQIQIILITEHYYFLE